MIRAMFRGLGYLALFLATAAFLTGAGLFVLGAFFLTFPILKVSPRQKRLEATVRMAAATMTLLSTLQTPEPTSDTGKAVGGAGSVSDGNR